MNKVPKCLGVEEPVSTLHMYMTNSPTSNICREIWAVGAILYNRRVASYDWSQLGIRSCPPFSGPKFMGKSMELSQFRPPMLFCYLIIVVSTLALQLASCYPPVIQGDWPIVCLIYMMSLPLRVPSPSQEDHWQHLFLIWTTWSCTVQIHSCSCVKDWLEQTAETRMRDSRGTDARQQNAGVSAGNWSESGKQMMTPGENKDGFERALGKRNEVARCKRRARPSLSWCPYMARTIWHKSIHIQIWSSMSNAGTRTLGHLHS